MAVVVVYIFAPSSRVHTKIHSLLSYIHAYMYTRTSLVLRFKNPGRFRLSNFSIPAWSSTNLSWTLLAEHPSHSLELVDQKWGWCAHQLPLFPSGYHPHNFAQCHAISNNRLKVCGGVLLNLRCTMGAKWLVSEFSNFLISVRLPTPGAPEN